MTAVTFPIRDERPELRALPLYDRDVLSVRFQLSDNTNPAGAPPSAERTLRDVTGATLSQYPTTYSAVLRTALASYVGVSAEQVVVGCGSDELIDCALRALVAPGGRVAYCDPTFVMARIFAVANALEPVPVPFAPDHDIDVDALIAARPALVYLCRPNNPTGTVFAASRLDQLLARFDGIVVVDEAYAEYITDPITPRAPSLERVVCLRTLSKAWGVAGLRVGYAVGSRSLIDLIERVRGPFKLTAPSERVAATVLRADRGWMQDQVAATLSRRTRFEDGLRQLGYTPVPSHGNFVFVPVPDSKSLADRLLDQEVAVRAFTNLTGIGDALRITVGPDEAIERVLQVLSGRRA